MDPDKKVTLRHYEIDPMNGPGQMVTETYAQSHEPFVVFCSSEHCQHSIENVSAIPFWTEDCKEHLGVLRCPECGSPVVRPRRD